MCVIGNPPYSGHSSNKGDWIEGLMADYKVSPELKRPAQAKWLSDDYVKFIRMGEHMIERNGKGVLGFITNHGYLDNPTFLDMRDHLRKTFDCIYVLDLHGNAKKKEVAPDGSSDKNVFDIQQGVAIFIAIKLGSGSAVARQWLGRPSFRKSATASFGAAATPRTKRCGAAPCKRFAGRMFRLNHRRGGSSRPTKLWNSPIRQAVPLQSCFLRTDAPRRGS
jgi:hypothetical protein